MLVWRILLITLLYIIQACIQGLTEAIPLYLVSYKASWKQQGIFSWAIYPFSFKILWAPILDSIYIHRFGRYYTWFIPVEFIIGIILIILSFYLDTFLTKLQISLLTIFFFLLYFLIATHDIIVDGWSVALFNSSNPQWASTCQCIGRMIGIFIGLTLLMTFESSEFTNKYIRQPLSLPLRSYGLFTLEQFTFFLGITFIIVSITLIIILCYKTNNNNNIEKSKEIKSNLFQTYLSILKLFKKQCIRELIFIMLTWYVGFGAIAHMTHLTLSQYGIKRDSIALMNIPLFIINIVLPLCLSNTRHPLIWFARGYILRLITAFILVIYIYFTPQILHRFYFYPILTVLLCLNEMFAYLMVISYLGFYARISDLQIAGTYVTFLITISNLGNSISSTIVRYIANWLPKSHAYSIEVGISLILGIIWIGFTWRIMKRLSELPIKEWYLKPSTTNSLSTDHI